MAKVAYKISDLIGGAGGGGGGGLTPTAISVSATVTSGKHYLVNTSAGAFTVTLPAGSVGAALKFTDAGGTWGTNPLTIATSQSIDNQTTADPLICDVAFGWVEISWNGTKWITTTQNLVNVPAATASTQGTVAGGLVPGSNGASTIPVGMIGERYSSTISILLNPTGGSLGTYLDFTGLSVNIPSAGVWSVSLRMAVEHSPGGTGFTIVDINILNASNAVLASMITGSASANGTNAMPARIYNGGYIQTVVVTTAPLVVRGCARINTGAITPTIGIVNTRGDITPAVIEIVRIA